MAANVNGPTPGAYQMASTNWIVRLGRFCLLLHLDAQHELGDLKTFIDQQTRGNVAPTPLEVNGISGVTYGDYGPRRTWVDWWFKKGDVMLCICLQSIEFPRAEPDYDERAEHTAIIQSLTYSRDFPTEYPPLP